MYIRKVPTVYWEIFMVKNFCEFHKFLEIAKNIICKILKLFGRGMQKCTFCKNFICEILKKKRFTKILLHKNFLVYSITMKYMYMYLCVSV